MIQLSVYSALAIILLWPAGLWLCSWKYLRAYRAGQKTDALIWFGAWCTIIAMVEWFAIAWYVVVQGVRSAL